MENDATFMIYSDKNRIVDLSFNALSFYRPRSIEIFVNDLQMQTQILDPKDGFKKVIVPGISLKEGANIVRFHVPEGCERPSDMKELNNPDSRCLSLAVQDIKITKDILINDTKSSSISLGDGWHGLEDWDGTPTRWMEQDATLVIYSDENCTADLSFNALSFYRPRTLEIFVNDLPHIRAEVPSDGFVMVTVSSISLNEGANIVRFHVPEGCERPSDIAELNNRDTRCLSVAVQGVRIIS